MEETESLINQDYIPIDKYHLVYIITYLLGVTTLLPWNFFITGEKYFHFKLRNTTLPSNTSYVTPLQHYFESSLAVSATIANVLCNIIVVIIVKRVGMKTRFITSFVSIILLLGLTVSFVKVNTNSYQTAFFVIVLLTIIFLSGSSAVLNATALGFASIMPTKYINALMGGQALGGTFASLANILALATLHSVTDSALLYFIIAILVTILTFFGYFYFYKLEFSRYYIFRDGSSYIYDVHENDKIINKHPGQSSTWTVFLKIWKWGFAALLTFAVTLSCFPAASSSIQPINDLGWFKRFYSPVVNFFVFNVTDLLGRIIAGKTCFLFKPKSSMLFLTTALLRIVFIPLIMLCNVQPREHMTVLFDNDYAAGIIIFFLGLSNGFISNTSMMLAPRLVENHEAEQTGTVLSLFVTIGLAIGSCFSVLVIKLV
ncbi:equilibrative nucleoside transporter 3 [Octopus bimaculoides]|uniref:Equilibrative nucleoside transporter 3 n=1 Tax=Octopus bimaculoides TaxID=37653 RepID=A0A0L8GBJ3_OCTBM|nr:equilibrative nucleoside transporter 3 [Octopus bimaculoides]|eukprot:XP_014782442.1 PREDICTED: equilibrative nucleoside transporter 3-like [Octopus bimaculoides]